MKSSSKRRFLPINSGWTEAAQSDRPPKIGFARNAHCTPVSQRRLRLTQQKKRQRTLRVSILLTVRPGLHWPWQSLPGSLPACASGFANIKSRSDR
jgi:hypothetical protein